MPNSNVIGRKDHGRLGSNHLWEILTMETVVLSSSSSSSLQLNDRHRGRQVSVRFPLWPQNSGRESGAGEISFRRNWGNCHLVVQFHYGNGLIPAWCSSCWVCWWVCCCILATIESKTSWGPRVTHLHWGPSSMPWLLTLCLLSYHRLCSSIPPKTFERP